MEKKYSNLRGAAMLGLAALLWGSTFVAQSAGMDHIGPLTFLFARSVVGSLVLLLLIPLLDRLGISHRPSDRAARAALWRGGALCGVVLCLASGLQQFGIVDTDSGKTAFITTLYMIMVPLVGLFFGRKISKAGWAAVGLAILGSYLLCVKPGTAMSVERGELLVFFCAMGYTAHILVIDAEVGSSDGVRLSCIQFFVIAVLAGIGMLLFEQPTWQSILDCTVPILYAGVLSSGVGYTLQILAQKITQPTVAALMMSLESVFAVLFGWLIRGETLSTREAVGCVLIFVAILLTQIPLKKLWKRWCCRQRKKETS